MKTKIYYFSATGNSLFVAKKAAETLEDCSIENVTQCTSEIIAADTESVGFIFPMYYFGMPEIMVSFIKKLDLTGVKYIFAVITKGVPSAGGALAQLGKLLKKKGKKLNLGSYLAMGDNFIIMWWDSTQKDELSERQKNAGEKILELTDAIRSGRNKVEKNAADYIPFIFRHLPILGYNHYVKKSKSEDKYFYTDGKCTSCGICINVCSTGNIKLGEGGPQWLHSNCQQCLACLHLCPQKTIQFGKRVSQFRTKTENKQRYKNPNININELFAQK